MRGKRRERFDVTTSRRHGLSAGLLMLVAGTGLGVASWPVSAVPQVGGVVPPDLEEPPEAQPEPKKQPEAASPQATKDLASEESLARFQQLLARRPFHGPAFTGLVNYYAERGKLAELIAEYAAKVKALPEDVALRIVLARLHLRSGDAAAAVPLLANIEKLEGDLARANSELLVLKSEVYQRTGDNESALKMLKEAQALATSVSEQLRLGEALADLYLRDNRRDDAVKSLEELAKQFPDNYLHQKRVAGSMAQRGLHQAAVDRYRAMLPLVKDEVDRRCEVLREMGQSLERLEKRDEAIAVYVEAVGLLASDHWLQKDLHERIVALYRAGNRLDDLAAYCRAQIARAPEQTAMRILLADVQNAMGKPEEGKQTLAEAVELFPKDAALSQKRVEYLERLGDIEGVSAEYQRAIGQHPDDVELYVAFGQSLANNKQIDAARNQWRHILSTRVDDAALALRLGALFETYELYDDAGEAYERAVTVNPKQPDAYTALMRMWLARGDADKAAAMLDRLGQASPDDASVQAVLAQELRNLGRTDAALAAITRACTLAPDQVRYHVVRADLLVQAGQLEEALEVRRAAIDRMTNPVQQADAIGTLISMYASADKLAALKERESKRLQEKADDKVALLLLASAADADRDFPEVRRRLDALLAADPGNETAMQQLAKLQDATGDIDASVETYTRLIQLHPTRAKQFYEAVVDLKLRYGDRAGAIETLQKMAQNDPANAGTASAVAEQLVRMDEPERALPFYEKSLQLQADRHDTRLDYGKALTDAGRLEEALAAFRAVATQRTDTDRASEALGRLHDVAQQLGRLEDLIDEMQQQVEADPQNTLVARVLAQLLVHDLEYSRAMQILDLVLRHNPRDVELALGRAEVLRALAKYDEAAEGYQKVLRFPQIDRDYVLGELGKTYFESGQVDQARRIWRQIQNKLYAGSLLKNNGLVEESIVTFEEGIRLKPDEYALHRNLIGALEAAGKTNESLSAARRLLDAEPGNVWNIQRLAEAYLRNGDRAGAAAVAGRMFSAAVSTDKPGAQSGSSKYQTYAGAMYAQQYSGAGGGAKNNLDRGIQFFTQNGLRAELEEVLAAQIKAQPDNAVLKETAAGWYTSRLNKPEQALALLRELETATFPVEHQDWLGHCSQRDHMRIRQYNLIATKPVLRDRELAALEAKKAEDLTRDELLELAVIRKAQGNAEKAIEHLTRAVQLDAGDALTLGVLTDLLVAGEKFKEAEPHARKLVEVLGQQRAAMLAETTERVRRDYVRSLPLEFQLRVTEALLEDIAEKWTLGQGWKWDTGSTEAVGYLRAKLTLGTICAETGRMEEARKLWQELAPRRGPDVDRWTMLGETAQLHKQEDLAYEFYQQALRAAKTLVGDPLLQQVYSSSAAQRSGYGQEGIDKAFNNIVDSFAKRDGLVELYDFLRDTDQEQRARRLAEQYKLGDALKTLYVKRVEEAAEKFRTSGDGPFRASTAYFAQVRKLAELLDREGKWDEAQAVYETYLKAFPDELGLLTLLGEVAEARLKTDEALEWEKKVLDCKERLSKRAREWSLRELDLTPSQPQVLSANRTNQWAWAQRWSKTKSYYTSSSHGELDRWPSWMRVAELHLTASNPIAAADAMQHAVAEAGARRDEVVRRALDLIQQRQLTTKMLPALRVLAVYAPTNERVQLAFAEALEAGGRKELALEVCNRMLRRGVSDLGVLAELKRRVQSLNPAQAAPEVTLATLEAEVAAQPANLKTRLQLAKACYYSLQVDRAQELLVGLVKEAPHLEDVHDLLVEVYTLRGDSEKLIDALKGQIERLTDERKRRTTRWRLVNELLATGKTDEALATVKDLGDPKDPRSYLRISVLLHYFGKSDEAIACLTEGRKSRSSNQYDSSSTDFAVAQSLAMRGDFTGAADKILAAVDEQQQQATQYGGMYALYDRSGNPFAALEAVFALYPELLKEVAQRVEARKEANPTDPQALKLLMNLSRSMGRPDKAEALLEQVAGGGAADQALVAQQIDLAVRRHEYARAIELAQKFIAQAPKPQVPPGMPAQYAGYAVLQSPRTLMLCKLGDVQWEMGEKEKAFEAYQQIVDKKVDETRVAYATICLLRGRLEEARKLIDEALAAQQVKPAALLQFRAFIAALDGDPGQVFDLLSQAAVPGGEEDPYGRTGSPIRGLAQLAQRAGQMERFAAFVQERIKKNPNEWENYDVLANAYWQAGQPAEALKVLDQTAQIPPLTMQALSLRLSWREGCAPVEELIPLYEKLIDLAEREVQADQGGGRWNPYESSGPGQQYRDQLADILWQQGDKEKAEKLWTERMNAQRADTHLRLGELYLKREAYEKAEKCFARAAELDPDNLAAHMALAEEAFHRGDRRAMLPHMLECFLRRPTGEEQNDRYGRYRGSGGEDDVEVHGRMYAWALALADDPELSAYLSGAELAPRESEYRIMIAALTGDTAGLETQVRARIEAGSLDPLMWKLLAQVQQRRGQWAEAVKTLDFLRRVKLTSLGDHRDRLKLVLAGKQLKEAAAGTRQAPPGAGAPTRSSSSGSGYYGGGYYGGYGDWWEDDPGTSLLPSLYIKLGDFKQAERLYLLSSGGDGVEGRLPWLASLMWDQQAKERSLELMRLALAMPGDRYGGGRNMIPQYAAMLAEAGQSAQACDLLVRAYRYDSSNDENDMYYRWSYGNRGSQELEQGNEQGVSGALYAILAREGISDKMLKSLSEESARDPGDPRLAKLVLSLQKHGRRWGEQREALAARRAARPGELAMTLEQFHADCQLGKWDEALQLLEQVRKEAPEHKARWSAHEAFVQLMRGEPEKAAAVIQPLVSESGDENDYESAPLSAGPVVLAAAHRYEELTASLERKRKDGELSAGGTELLFRLLLVQKRWDQALALGLEEMWKEQLVIGPTDQWWRGLCALSAAAGKAGATLAAAPDRAADAAVLALLREGPKAGVQAFTALAEKPEPTLESLRGLLLAAAIAGDEQVTARANARVVQWLEGRRMEAWYRQPEASLQHMAQRAVERTSRAGTTQIAQGGGLSQQIAGIVGSRSGGARTMTYDALWRAHAQLQRSFLARAGDAAALRALLQSQARTFQSSSYGGYDEDMYLQGYGAYDDGGSRTEWMLQSDLPALERKTLFGSGRMDTLLGEYERAGLRIPESEWQRLGEASAAGGKADAATAWRRRAAELRLVRLRATDRPDLGASARDPWRWYWYYGYGQAMREAQSVRAALQTPIDPPAEPDTDPIIHGQANDVWETALIDPIVEKQLLRAGDEVGPGWSGTQTLAQLVSYYRAKGDAKKVLELIDRTGDPDQLLRSPRLPAYVWACFKAGADDRLQKLLEGAKKIGSTLENDVAIARLILLQRAGKTAEADQLEGQLLSRCVTETPNPHQPDAALVAPAWSHDDEEQKQMNQYKYYQGRGYGQGIQLPDDLSTATQLAAALGVRFDPRMGEENTTVAALREAYQRHGLHAQAARLLEREVTTAPSAHRRWELTLERATEQHKAGQKDAAQRTARELEALLQAELTRTPASADTYWRLAECYASEAFGPDYAKAYEALTAARKADPGCDAGGVEAVHFLYKLGRHREAWDAWKAGRANAGAQAYEEPTLYYASLAALQGGDQAAGRGLALQALYRYPASPLAKHTRELIDARP